MFLFFHWLTNMFIEEKQKKPSWNLAKIIIQSKSCYFPDILGKNSEVECQLSFPV